jgi:hypothetical protein
VRPDLALPEQLDRQIAPDLECVRATLHQHIFRQRFYEPAAGGVTIAKFTQDWLDGKFAHTAPLLAIVASAAKEGNRRIELLCSLGG